MTPKPTPPCLGCKDRVAEINSILNAIERRRIDMARKHKFNRFKGEKK